MVFVYGVNKISEKCVMKIDSNKLIDIMKKVEYLGTDGFTYVGKEKLRLLNLVGVSHKLEDKAIRDVKILFKLFARKKKKKRPLLKQGCN